MDGAILNGLNKWKSYADQKNGSHTKLTWGKLISNAHFVISISMFLMALLQSIDNTFEVYKIQVCLVHFVGKK